MNVGMVHRVTVRRESPTGGEDDWGLPVEGVVTVGTDVAALVQDRAARELPRPMGVEITDALIFLPLGADVRADDLIDYGTKTYRIVGTPVDAGGAGHHIEASGRLVSVGG